MAHYVLFLTFSKSYLEKRETYRAEHLKKAWESANRGELILAGALTDPLDSGIILFSASGPEVVEEFVQNDPYIQNGLVEKWNIRHWHTAVGKDAASPLQPADVSSGS